MAEIYLCGGGEQIRERKRPDRDASMRVVRAEGFEPPRLSSREPKSRASANSATPAKGSFDVQPMSGAPDIGRLNAQVGNRRPALRPGGAAYIMPKAQGARQKYASNGAFSTANFRPKVKSRRPLAATVPTSRRNDIGRTH